MSKNNNTKLDEAYVLKPWPLKNIKFYEYIKDVFKENFDEVSMANFDKGKENTWFIKDGDLYTYDADEIGFWQNLAIAYDVLSKHEEHIKVFYKNDFMQKTNFLNKLHEIVDAYEQDDLMGLIRFTSSLPENNIYRFIVEAYTYDKENKYLFKSLKNATLFAAQLWKNEIIDNDNKGYVKIYGINYYDLYRIQNNLLSVFDAKKTNKYCIDSTKMNINFINSELLGDNYKEFYLHHKENNRFDFSDKDIDKYCPDIGELRKKSE